MLTFILTFLSFFYFLHILSINLSIFALKK